MTISGFTMVRNGAKYYYPIKQAISSILPIVDEFIVAPGVCDPDDCTLEEIESIGSDKIRIIHTVWDRSRPSPSGGYRVSTASITGRRKGPIKFD